ncbi:MAG: cysteine--tRNA ligase [Leucobacter sp.]
MTQRIYDSRKQAIVDFAPLQTGKVGMYVCGPTVQSAPHIGHLRSALVYDQMRRWFTATGLDVTLIRNVTDIDDKILDNARLNQEQGSTEEWWALAYRVEREFTAVYDALGILAPTYEPRATANIQEMITLIERLIERGHAYQAGDGTANVYFDTASWSDYGELTHQRLDQMEDATDSEPLGKRDPRDFALWKAHRDSEPETAAWASPWGDGRPGWHIECSAMAARYLGESFDIHGGGLDLRFPHHENEIAQSRAAGQDFATHWIHNGLVNIGSQKMSKSLGNSLFAADLLHEARPIVVRYFLGSAHYRSVLDFSESSLTEAASAFERIEGFVRRAAERVGVETLHSNGVATLHSSGTEALPDEFVAAMNDDFALPQALAVLHGSVRTGSAALAAGDDETVLASVREVIAMLDVLGLNPNDVAWAQEDAQASFKSVLDTLMKDFIEQRASARAEKDFATSDMIRDRLTAAGITLEDNPNGTRWSLI